MMSAAEDYPNQREWISTCCKIQCFFRLMTTLMASWICQWTCRATQEELGLNFPYWKTDVRSYSKGNLLLSSVCCSPQAATGLLYVSPVSAESLVVLCWHGVARKANSTMSHPPVRRQRAGFGAFSVPFAWSGLNRIAIRCSWRRRYAPLLCLPRNVTFSNVFRSRTPPAKEECPCWFDPAHPPPAVLWTRKQGS